MYTRQRATLKASESGKSKIQQARKRRGWIIEDDRWLSEATEIISRNGVRGAGVALITWKRFLQAKLRIEADTFKAFCQVLGLNWEDVVDTNSNVDLSLAPPLSSFCGRTKELRELEQWLQERCRLIVIYGMGGIGKKALTRQLVEKISHKYDYVIWRSLESAPPFQDFCTELAQFLCKEQNNEVDISQLMQCLHQQKCLLVLEAWEEITSDNSEDYDEYCDFFKRVAKETHQSSVLLLSRETPRNIKFLESNFVRLLRLGSLTPEEAREILIAEGLSGTPDKLEAFSLRYSNPWILKKVASKVRTVFDGEVSNFVENTSVFVDNEIMDFLDNQFNQLSELEKKVIYWIAIRRNTASWNQLVEDKAHFLSYDLLFQTLDYLIQGRSLVNKNVDEVPIIYTLEPVILKYTTNRFAEEACQQIIQITKSQIIQGNELFFSHSFVTENTDDDDLNQQQVRRIVKSIQDKLLDKFKSWQGVQDELMRVLSLLEEKGLLHGYGRRNISRLLTLHV
ncbi:WD-repeat protein [Calothrix sp. NIES-4071]|nr:WD-repeat protein [Calothrix sp. NIES-4071]BAZ55994.1 WD-repeat protein [Calothrix sp. NIES-4105]